AGVPAGEIDVIVENVGTVPAEDHVAKAEAALGGGAKLIERDVLTAQDAVDVDAAQLHLVDLVLLKVLLDLLEVHGSNKQFGAKSQQIKQDFRSEEHTSELQLP